MIVAVCGPKRSGKDTIASHLVSRYGYTRIAFADPLKHVVAHMFGFTEQQMETDEKEHIDVRWGTTPRKAMQFFGTEVMQYKIQELLPGIGTMFWTKALLLNIQPGKMYVVSDLRFIHEYEALKERGAFIIKVERPIENNDTHVSEQEFKKINADTTVVNDSTIENLLSKIDNIVSQI